MDKIAIDSTSEERVLLAEEIGHYETGGLYIMVSTYNMSVARSKRIRCEAKARFWSYKCLLPPDEIENAIKHEKQDDYAIAEFCSVTVNFLREAIAYHRSCGIVFSFDD